MTRRGRSRWILVAAVLGVLAAVGAVTLARTSPTSPGPSAAPTAPSSTPAATRARQAVDGFFETYVQPDGRVARVGQAGDTVSEGQAYALLMAAGTGDQVRFDQVWTWTRDNLRQENGLLAWLWADGVVVDASAAADADLYAAAALTLAAQRFGDGDGTIDYRAEAAALSDAIFAGATVVLGSSRVLVAGPWATESRVINPSYLATPVMSIAYSLRHDERWLQLESSSRAILESLTVTGPRLPPDWAVASVDGRSAVPRAASDGTPPRYGWDAARIPIQLAVDCDPGGRRIGARLWPFLNRTLTANAGSLVGAYSLAGVPVTSAEPPSALVGAAGAAAAAGDRAAADRLLDAAVERDRAAPSYFGAAWVALGLLWLDTDLLSGCRPGAPTG